MDHNVMLNHRHEQLGFRNMICVCKAHSYGVFSI